MWSKNKSMRRITGIIILCLVFTGLFIGTTISVGFLKALMVWGMSIGLSVIIIIALKLILDNGKN
jgi:hypothetical protein